jgi:serine/threonine protein kinase
MVYVAHKFLYDQGILHRDVSAGNILLSYEKNPREGCEGFITDVEYAHVTRPSLDSVTTTHVAPVRGPGGVMTPPMTRTHTKFIPVKRGAAMTVRLLALCRLLIVAFNISLGNGPVYGL